MENEALVLDLLEWIAAEPRRYTDVMEAWRTSCPRLPIWEDAVDARFVQRRERMVHITEQGLGFLKTHARIA